MKSYVKNYPRPQFFRPSWQLLDGVWDFAFDDNNIGEKEKWQINFKKQHDITVPFSYETKMSGIGDETPHPYVWYRHTIDITKTDIETNRLWIHFEGCDFYTKVYVNGYLVGDHTGGYSRFSFDITDHVNIGENTITVRAEDHMDEQQPRGKQRWTNQNFACWYVQTTGIWKSVWTEYVPIDSICSVKMTPILEKSILEIEAQINSQKYEPNLVLEATVSFNDKFVNKVIVPVTRKNIKTEINVYSTDIYEWGVMEWSPEQPNLYDIQFELKRDSNTIDTVLSYFGMRDIRIEQGNILLNFQPIYQRLILDQGYWKDSHLTPPNEQALIDDIDKIMALGYNGLRKHQKTEDERFLYWCDVKGMLVWSEYPAAYMFSDYAVELLTNEWMSIVKQNYNHPSIITWTPFNESWGVPRIEINQSQQNFTEAIYHLTKSFDKYRPVIVNDGWEHTISDIITLHDYEELGQRFLDRYNDLDSILNNINYHSNHKSAMANGYEYKGQPIIISEYGGIAFNNDDSGWGYGNKVNTKEDFIKRFDDITTAVKKFYGCVGFCYTQVTDVQQEINGLMDIQRNFKIDPNIIKEINMRNVSPFYDIK